MQQMQRTFDLNMNPIVTHDEYPKYARSGTKPVVRARHIIDLGVISAHPCTTCVELGQDCYRLENTFSKCAYCTSKDRKRELCHLPGQEAAAMASLERRKRRKITQNIYAPSGDAASIADTMMSAALTTSTFASGLTPYLNIPMSIPRSVPAQTPTPEPTFAATGTASTQTVAPTMLKAAAEASTEATLERVTALESQVSGLESKVMDLFVKLDEVNSCISSRSTTPNAQAVAGGCASPKTSDVTLGDLQARNVSDTAATTARRATMEWVQGPKIADAVSSPMEVAKMLNPEEEANGIPKPQDTVEHAGGL